MDLVASQSDKAAQDRHRAMIAVCKTPALKVLLEKQLELMIEIDSAPNKEEIVKGCDKMATLTSEYFNSLSEERRNELLAAMIQPQGVKTTPHSNKRRR